MGEWSARLLPHSAIEGHSQVMARLTYRKSIRIAPGVRLNVTDKGVRSVSAGAGGLRLTQDLHSDRRGGGRGQAAAAAQPAKPTLSERTAALEARMSPDRFARHQEGSRLAGLWFATLFALVFSAVMPLAFFVSLPLLLVAIVKTVATARARRARV